MKKIITPGIFLLAALVSGACTDTDDIATEEDEETQTDPAECCAPDRPRGEDPIYDSFEAGRIARTRFDWLRHIRSK